MAMHLPSGKARGRRAPMAEINVTPLVDVVLVLLIIFMVVTPMLTRGRDVRLPVASTTKGQHESMNAVVLTIEASRKLWIDDREVSIDRLPSEFSRQMRDDSAQEVLIKADVSVTVRDLRPLLKVLKLAKISQIGFAVLSQGKP